MRYRKETEGKQLQQMSIDAHAELFKSLRYSEEQMEWFCHKLSTILAENFVYSVKTNMFELLPLAVSIFSFGIAFGLVIGEMFQ